MCASWNNKFNPQTILNKLEEIKIIKNDGKIEFKAFEHRELSAVLFSCVKFSEDLDLIDEEKHEIVDGSIDYVVKKGPLTSTKVLKRISKLEYQYTSRQNSPYIIATNISIIYFQELGRINIDGSSITFSRSFPLSYNRSNSEERYKLITDHKLPTNYTCVRVRVLARSDMEAFHKASESIDLLRAIWSLRLNKRGRMSLGSSTSKPVNVILLGPVFTLHNPNGKLKSSTFLYEQEFRTNEQCQLFDNKRWLSLRQSERDIRKKIRTSPRKEFKELIENSLRRYVRALDKNDLNIAFLELWGVFEELTGRDRSYDISIKRACFFFRDTEYHLQVLNHLRDYRNGVVHYSRNSRKIETLIYQLKVYVDNLLLFLIKRSNEFEDLKEFHQFMSTTTNTAELDRKIKLLKKVKRFRK